MKICSLDGVDLQQREVYIEQRKVNRIELFHTSEEGKNKLKIYISCFINFEIQNHIKTDSV